MNIFLFRCRVDSFMGVFQISIPLSVNSSLFFRLHHNRRERLPDRCAGLNFFIRCHNNRVVFLNSGQHHALGDDAQYFSGF